ncbi:MAG: hypothetical protein WA322_21175 [Pseudolabrys sp.]
MHEVNTVAAGLNRGRWLLAWARRRRVPDLQVISGGSAAPAKRMLVVSYLIIAFIILAMVTTQLGIGIGCRLARQSDAQLLSEQHAALRIAISEFGVFVRSDEIDPRLVRTAARIAGVKNIKLERDPDTTNREMYPLMNADGRIAGFFTWDKARPAMRIMDRVVHFAAAITVVVVGFGILSLWQLKRARRELAMREAQAARAADRDKLTGLPNHAKTLELLDLALAERADDDCTTFALIEVSGMEDVTAHHGCPGQR